MLKSKRRIVSVVLLVSMFLSGIFYVPVQGKGQEHSVNEKAAIVTIFNTNDMHGNMEASDSSVGIGKVAQLKADTPNSILVDDGDAVQGTTLATLSEGMDVIRLMNAAGYDVMGAGNHEFDRGATRLKELAAAANFPIICGNVNFGEDLFFQGKYKDGTMDNNGSNFIVEVGGRKIGFFALITKDTMTVTNPAKLTNITFRDEVETAKQQVTLLQQENVDAIVCISHMGNYQVSCSCEDLAKALDPGTVDVILDGHDHTKYSKVVNGVQLVETGTALESVGKTELTFEDDGDVVVDSQMLTPEDLKQTDEKTKVTELLAQIKKEQAAISEQVVGKTKTALWGGTVNSRTDVRLVETNLGDVITDAMMDKAKEIVESDTLKSQYGDLPIIAGVNGGGIRASIMNGVITVGDVINALPFSNTISVVEITPQKLYEVMEHSLYSIEGMDTSTGYMTGTWGGFLQFSGCQVAFDPNGETGKRVEYIKLDGQTDSLKKDDSTPKMLFVTNDYLAAGGNGYDALATCKEIGQGGDVVSALSEKIKKLVEEGNGIMSILPNDNRLVIHSAGYEKKDYKAYIHVLDEKGNSLVGKTITYYVDDGDVKTGTVNNQGCLEVIVPDGIHGVKVCQSGQEVLINNYSGAGTKEEVVSDYLYEFPKLTVPESSVIISNPVVTPVITPTEQPIQGAIVTTIDKVKVGKTSIIKVVKKKKKTMIKAKKITQVDGYQFVYGSNRKFTKNKKVKNQKSNVLSLKKKKSSFYIKVRGYKMDSKGKKVYGKFSTTKKIKQ